MTKAELITHLAKENNMSKAATARFLDSLVVATNKTLKRSKEASIPGLGKFVMSKRSAYTGRNPATGEAVKIKARKTVRFRPGKGMKDAVT